jgi:hypothetical protein
MSIPLCVFADVASLLEDGCLDDEDPKPHMKVGTIAISNWALDPAKMNRCIHVQRYTPNIRELEDTAWYVYM